MSQLFTGTSAKSLWTFPGDFVSRKLWSLESKELCAEARCRTGLEDFGDPAIERRLSILVKSIESEANLHPMGRFLARMHLRELLETRLLLADAWSKSEALDAEAIERPIFITGMPRSGSTFLHELLVQDTGSRAPLVWEVMFPLTDPAAGTRETNRRIRKTAAYLWWFRRMTPGADSFHPMRATTPHECVAIHSYTLLTQEFATIFHVPSYEAFLNAADFSPVYAWQKRFLQHLQMRRPAKRWVLKAPDHVFNLEALFGAFPDAVIIQLHRNPLDVLKSSSQLTEVLRRTFARSQDKDQIGERETLVLAEGMDRIARFRDSHPALASRFLDINFDELVADPLGIVHQCYRHLDFPLTDATIERARNLASHRSRYAHRRIGPTLADHGIDSETAARRFKNYCARFGIECLQAESA
ncbi:MAG: sulfotransferase [Pedosphaera sp.]|nr:sulfotransferase [Pedosphaera sp.]